MEFKATGEVKRFNAACEVTRQGAFIGLLTGEPGVGKTRAARRYAEDDRNSIYIKLNPFSEKSGNFIMQLAEIAGSYHCDRTYRTYSSLKYCLNSSKFLLIDEADFFSDKGLNVIRVLWEESKCPVMLIGSNELLGRVQQRKLLHLESRIGLYEVMGKLSFLELQKILPDMDLRLIKFIYKKTHGNFRLIDRLMNQIKRIIELNKLPKANKEIIEEAARLIRVS